MQAKPTESELEILSILWELKTATVRDIHERLALTKDTGYTTTLKIMQIMHAKGLLLRDEQNRTHVYRPAVDEQVTRKGLVSDFVATAFGGSAKNLVMQALGQAKPSLEELDEIRAFLNQLEKDQ
ncbi:Transcriptional repressor, BlaI/MecI family [Mariniradius saccharolyticus AK6]|uniref:Transcriptional repressor, BlaI/MecI family n=1 Tax=Mariniradius saccharolyticus AK6 TaxID=1239962 RepID=M7Y347_9BACT|nr:BlaI/MecI/CopY family transcriptional regulator [Mariniradius saccharolyticus]EMS35182.1 Transcriptional repressor, BlaI/MecI family [Mariniradius saccharolyticus AK6]